MGRKLTSEACYKDRDDDDGTTDYTVLCLQMAVHGMWIRLRLLLICHDLPPSFLSTQVLENRVL